MQQHKHYRYAMLHFITANHKAAAVCSALKARCRSPPPLAELGRRVIGVPKRGSSAIPFAIGNERIFQLVLKLASHLSITFN